MIAQRDNTQQSRPQCIRINKDEYFTTLIESRGEKKRFNWFFTSIREKPRAIGNHKKG